MSFCQLRKLNASLTAFLSNWETRRYSYCKEERGYVFIRWLCVSVCVSLGPPVGQHVSAPAVSLSQAVISTYHRNLPAKEDTGTHNAHSGLPLLHLNVQLSYASPLFSFGLQLVRSCRANNRVSPASFSNCNKGVLRLLERRQDPGMPLFKLLGMLDISAKQHNVIRWRKLRK